MGRLKTNRAPLGALGEEGRLASIGFIASGFDPAVFTTQIDMRDSTIVLGGVEADDPESIPFVSQLANLGEIDTSDVADPAAP